MKHKCFCTARCAAVGLGCDLIRETQIAGVIPRRHKSKGLRLVVMVVAIACVWYVEKESERASSGSSPLDDDNGKCLTLGPICLTLSTPSGLCLPCCHLELLKHRGLRSQNTSRTPSMP